jgi:hypothetical protein
MAAGIFIDLGHLRFRHFASKNATYALPSRMYVEHYLNRPLLVHAEKTTQYFDDKVHGGEIVIEQHHLKQRWTGDLRTGGFQCQTVLIALLLLVLRFVGHG